VFIDSTVGFEGRELDTLRAELGAALAQGAQMRYPYDAPRLTHVHEGPQGCRYSTHATEAKRDQSHG
jgi:hypothetical protein